MALYTFRTPIHPVDVQPAVLELLGHQLRSVFPIDLAPPTAGPIADCLNRLSAEPLRDGAWTKSDGHAVKAIPPDCCLD